ncbi:MAG: hypothetical protein K9L69_02300 [Candidatus Omnitrophica bacterium]|nr:hypothetical protein [Candidatus Omnitrophota bacterium]MCF7894952.1 hypothetical protein [Candidatus Omnitrophota bacterium]
MVKKELKIVLASIFIALTVSCTATSTYSQKNIEQIIEKLCQEEFNIEVNAWLVEETLWVYVPLDKTLDEIGQPTDSFSKKTRQIFLTLKRAFLNMNNPPQFYCFVVSDIKDKGIDFYRIGFVPDLIKFQMGLISLQQFNQRMVFVSFENKKALGDNEGGHIVQYNINIGDFIGYLIRQELNNVFVSYSEKVKVKQIQSYYQKGKLGIIFDIEIDKKNKNISEPFGKAREIIKKYLEIYGRPKEIIEIEIINSSGKKSIFTQSALFD